VKADGTTVTVPYTVANRGPSTATEVQVGITAPTGTTFAAIPTGCAAVGNERILCLVADTLAPNRSLSRSFSLRITGDTVGTDGSIVVFAAEADPVAANDDVQIAVQAAPAPALTQGRLPVTGSQWGAVGGTGAALLLLGGVLTVIGRRETAPVRVDTKE
jgi:hypothetical protein